MSAFVLLSMARSLRTCLFSSDAAQWWPGLLGCGQWVGHGLDTGGAVGGQESGQEGGYGGQPAAAYRRKGFINLCQNSW